MQVFIACLVANTLYLFCRSIFTQRIHLKIGAMLSGESTDFLESQQTLAGLFVNFVAPLQISLFIDRKYHDQNEKDAGHQMLNYQMRLQWFQSISIFYLVFVSFFKCPSWLPVWIKIGPLIHAGLTLMSFLIIPLLSLFSLFANFDTISSSMAGSALLLYPLVCIVVVFVWFPLQVLPIALSAAGFVRREQRKFTQRRGCSTAEEWDEKMAQLEEDGSLNDENSGQLLEDKDALRDSLYPSPEPYLQTIQDAGNGGKRIGTPLSLREDLYALLFAANIRTNMKTEALALAEKRQDALDKVLNKQMAEDGTGEDPVNQEEPEEEKNEDEIEAERKAEEKEKAKEANNDVQKRSVFLS